MFLNSLVIYSLFSCIRYVCSIGVKLRPLSISIKIVHEVHTGYLRTRTRLLLRWPRNVAHLEFPLSSGGVCLCI